MAASSQAQTYCFVQWDDDNNDYAVVHAKRAKTLFPLKVGLTTSFEGNNRDRRRGKILYIGNKSDCTVFSFDFEQSHNHVNTYSWSLAPGLAEHIEETARAIKRIGNGNLSRAPSSSSVTSLSISTGKGKKTNQKEKNLNKKSSTLDADIITILPPPTTSTISGSLASTITIIDNQPTSNVDAPCPSNAINKFGSSTISDEGNVLCDHDGLLQENKLLRQKINELEEQLIFQREISIPIPDEHCYRYMKSFCSVYEQVHNDQNHRLNELAKKLPCTAVEIKLAKKPNPSSTINNLVKYCFKDVDFADMSYEKLKALDSILLIDIYEYVKYVHAPTVITQSMFSGAISLKCRHIRDNRKNKNQTTSTLKDKAQKKSITEQEARTE